MKKNYKFNKIGCELGKRTKNKIKKTAEIFLVLVYKLPDEALTDVFETLHVYKTETTAF